MKPEYRILLADNHILVRNVISQLLSTHNNNEFFIIDQASDGHETLDKVFSNDYDAILIDHELPVLTGPDVIRRIKQVKPETRILGMTAYDDRAYINELLNSGALGVIIKGTGLPTLLEAILATIKGKRFLCSQSAKRISKPD